MTAPSSGGWWTAAVRTIVAADPACPGHRPLGRDKRHAGIPATLAVPVVVQDKTIGVIYAEHQEPGRSFASGDEEAVAFLCAQAAAPLWNFELEARLRERRRVSTVPHGRAIEIRAQRTAADSRYRRPASCPQRLPGRASDDGAHLRYPGVHDPDRGHGRRSRRAIWRWGSCEPWSSRSSAATA